MTSITLKQLRYFEAVARHGHFGRAAADCAISQPALSMQIKDLEEALGVQLFERGGKQVRLTRFGEEAVQRARDIHVSVDGLVDLARASKSRLIGRVRIGVIPTIAPYILPSVVRDLSRIYPEVDLHIRETLTSKLIQELADNKLDVAIVALPVSEPLFQETALFSENFVLLRPAVERDHPVPEPEALREMRLLLLEEGHCFRDQALDFCSMKSSQPREVLDASSLTTLVQMVGGGMGVTLIPEMAVGVETRSADVAVSRFQDPQPERTIGMIWRKSNPLSQQFSEIATFVKRSAEHFLVMQHPAED